MLGGQTSPGPDSADTETWDGTAWTEVANLPATSKESGGTGGPSNMAFLAGFGGGGAPTSECDFWIDILNAPSFFSSLIVAGYLVTPSSVCLLDHTLGPVAGLSV